MGSSYPPPPSGREGRKKNVLVRRCRETKLCAVGGLDYIFRLEQSSQVDSRNGRKPPHRISNEQGSNTQHNDCIEQVKSYFRHMYPSLQSLVPTFLRLLVRFPSVCTFRLIPHVCLLQQLPANTGLVSRSPPPSARTI